MRPDPIKLKGRVTTLIPADESHAEQLCATLSPGLTDMLCAGPPDDPTAMRAYLRRWIDSDTRTPFVVQSKEDQTLLGFTNYISESPHDRAVEIGGTWLAARAHGTPVNPDMKLSMLTHAFETLGLTRVQLRGDNLNTRSKKAIEKLGATLEGVLRKHIPVRDATGAITRYRDTFVYSITDEEWPACKQHITQRLESRL